jgi:hypothetical protein
VGHTVVEPTPGTFQPATSDRGRVVTPLALIAHLNRVSFLELLITTPINHKLIGAGVMQLAEFFLNIIFPSMFTWFVRVQQTSATRGHHC